MFPTHGHTRTRGMFAWPDSPDVRLRPTRFGPAYEPAPMQAVYLHSSGTPDAILDSKRRWVLYGDYAALEERVLAWREAAPRYAKYGGSLHANMVQSLSDEIWGE